MNLAKLNLLFLVSDSSSEFGCLPNSDTISDVPRCRHSYSVDRHHSPEISLRPDSSHSPSSPVSPPAVQPLRIRSRSPVARRCFIRVLGYLLNLEQLKFIRIIRNVNPKRQFEIRSYTFPRDIQMYLKGRRDGLLPMPTEVQMVLSTSDGDIFAVFDKNYTLLRGIYARVRVYRGEYQAGKRVRINMYNGVIESMTQEEKNDCPIGSRSPISKNFVMEFMNGFSSQS